MWKKKIKNSEFIEWQESGALHGDMHVIRSGEEDYSTLHSRQRTLGNAASMEGGGGGGMSTLMANPLNMASAGGSKKWKKGQKCEAPFEDHGYYPCTIVQVNGVNTTVNFDGYDGDDGIADVLTALLK